MQEAWRECLKSRDFSFFALEVKLANHNIKKGFLGEKKHGEITETKIDLKKILGFMKYKSLAL